MPETIARRTSLKRQGCSLSEAGPVGNVDEGLHTRGHHRQSCAKCCNGLCLSGAERHVCVLAQLCAQADAERAPAARPTTEPSEHRWSNWAIPACHCLTIGAIVVVLPVSIRSASHPHDQHVVEWRCGNPKNGGTQTNVVTMGPNGMPHDGFRRTCGLECASLPHWPPHTTSRPERARPSTSADSPTPSDTSPSSGKPRRSASSPCLSCRSGNGRMRHPQRATQPCLYDKYIHHANAKCMH